MPWVTTLDLFFNPASGSFREARLAELAEAFRAQGFETNIRETLPGSGRIESEAELICIHGGDGALRDTVEALGDAAGRIPLCIAPSGTINLVARELGYSNQPTRLARQVADAWRAGAERRVKSPLYRLGGVPITACLSIGPDSHAVARVSGSLKRRIGRYAYVVAMLVQLREWPRERIAISGELADGTPFSCEAEAAIVSHGALYGGPFRLSPGAALVADSVELITIGHATRSAALAATALAMARLPVDWLDAVTIRTVRRILFDRCASPVQVDGDHIENCAYAIEPSGLSLTYVI